MTFTTIKDDIKAFGKKKHGYMTGYIAKQEELHKQLQNGMIGKKYAKDQLEAYKLEGTLILGTPIIKFMQKLKNSMS